MVCGVAMLYDMGPSVKDVGTKSQNIDLFSPLSEKCPHWFKLHGSKCPHRLKPWNNLDFATGPDIVKIGLAHARRDTVGQ